MPPKPKFTREEVIQAALQLVSRKGMDGLTARELGESLGSSARPIFTLFKNMEELQTEVRAAAMRRFETYGNQISGDMPLFKQVGMRMVLFGMEEPKLYQLLFMRENRKAAGFDELFGELDPTATACIELLCHTYNLSVPDARALFENVWIHTFGMGALCATGVCRFSEEQVSAMLTTEFQAMLTLIKLGRLPSKEPSSR